MTHAERSLIDRLAEADVALTAWQAEIELAFKRQIDVVKVFNEGSGERFKTGILAAGKAAREEVGTAPEKALFVVLDAFCGRYLEAPNPERVAMREAMASTGATRGHLLWYIARCARRLEETNDREWLRLALAAASLSELHPDYRDLYLSLGALYVTAIEAGIEPGSAFQEASELSNREVDTFLRTSTHDFLANFERSAYFDSIRAEVAEARANPGTRARTEVLADTLRSRPAKGDRDST